MERIVEREVSMKILSFGSLNIDYVYNAPLELFFELNFLAINMALRWSFAEIIL